MTEPRDFFISYNRADERWAEWIACTLRDAGYTHYFQKWDFQPGGNFVLEMDKAAAKSSRTLLVLSPNYLGSLYTQPEWAAAFSRDPTGEKKIMLPVRVAPCEPGGLLKAIVYCDLVGLGPDGARKRLLESVTQRVEPAAVPFPGPNADEVEFPGPATTLRRPTDSRRRAAAELQSIFATTRTTFIAQANLRDDLTKRIIKRLRIRERYQYEELFDRYFEKLQPDELRLHRVIRAYTESILHDYNKRALELVEGEPELEEFIPSIPRLRDHLILWLSKFDRVFRSTPSMCLLYVGVEEGVGFPSRIEQELNEYLVSPNRGQKLRGR